MSLAAVIEHLFETAAKHNQSAKRCLSNGLWLEAQPPSPLGRRITLWREPNVSPSLHECRTIAQHAGFARHSIQTTRHANCPAYLITERPPGSPMPRPPDPETERRRRIGLLTCLALHAAVINPWHRRAHVIQARLSHLRGASLDELRDECASRWFRVNWPHALRLMRFLECWQMSRRALPYRVHQLF